VGLLVERTPELEHAALAEAGAWRRLVFDAGFGWITGPERYGGRGLPASYERLYRSLEAGYDTPSQLVFAVSLSIVAPAVLAHGTETVRRSYLPRLHRGDLVAAQLFSEPGTGSDLAGVEARAERGGDGWVLTGHKTWITGAHYSDVGEVLCRTDPDAARHKGLTAFLVDLRAPGVEVRPIRQMTGGASFNDVVLDHVRVPDDHRLGEVGGGWTVAMTTLMNERPAIGGGMGTISASRLVELVRWLGRQEDPVLRQKVADVYIRGAVARATNQRAMANLEAGRAPGPELSIAKLSFTDGLRRIAEVAAEALGPRLAADTGEWGTYAWAELVLGVPGVRIAGGTDEVLKNVIAERVLGLPKEPR
jgi:alkylation response protein AidB-like acyl-CoA dehydrogenase